MLRLISLVMLAYSYFLVQTNISTLPRVIPTHFNASGAADGWGNPDALWVIFGAQALTCAIFLIVPYIGQQFPGAVHFGSHRLSDFPPAQRARLMPMLNDMAAYMSIVMNLFFMIVLRQTIEAATQPIPHLHMLWSLVLLFGGLLGIMLYYLRQFQRAAKGGVEGDSTRDLTA
ncbi:MAG: DUF1648 domain-containing protein [Terriglobia bacterium]